MSSVFGARSEIPPMMVQMVAVGEKTGNLSQMLKKIGEFYQGEVDRSVKNISSLMAPILLLVLGVGVGVLVAGVLMPMYGAMLSGA